MNADERGNEKKGPLSYRLSSLLLFITCLSVLLTLGGWVVVLHRQTIALEQRLLILERQQQVVSNVGVPLDIDEAMLMDNAIPNGMPLPRRTR